MKLILKRVQVKNQRVRAAYGRAKDPAVKKRLKSGLDYITKRKEASKKKTERIKKQKHILHCLVGLKNFSHASHIVILSLGVYNILLDIKLKMNLFYFVLPLLILKNL